MKNLFKITFLLTLLISFSCSESEFIEEQQVQNSIIDNSIDDLAVIQSTTTCTMYSISYDLNAKTETFGVSSNISNAIFSWSATGTITTVGTNTTNNTITIQYPNNYNAGDGVLIVSVTDSTNTSTHCGVTKHINTIGNNGNGNCGIQANIDEQIPVGYPTPNGKYSLSYTGNSSNVTWSVNNGVIVSSNGKFEVIVKATNLNPIILTATITEGSCVQTVTKEIIPINNCNTAISAYMEEDVKPCYPANNPNNYGWYTLYYTGSSNNITWSATNAQILYVSGNVQAKVKPNSSLPFTLTATITEGYCVKTISKVVYPNTNCEPGDGKGGDF